MAVETPDDVVREGVAEALSVIPGLHAFAEPQDQITPPTAMVRDPIREYHQTMGSPGSSRVVVEITLLAAPRQTTGLPHAYRALDAYAAPEGEQSVLAALERDVTLGGRVQTLYTPQRRDKGIIEWMGIPFIGAIWDVEIWP